VFKKHKKIILLAILVRFLVMPFFYHPDIKSQHYHFQFLSKGIFNVYQHIYDNKENLAYKDTFNYLPLTYYTFGSTQLISKPLLGNGFHSWINDWGETANNHPNIIFYLFTLKLPYLALDIGLAFLLLKISKNKKIFYFWLFNPISIYLIYILGNFDILPVFLTVLSFYFLKKNKLPLSYLSIGFAIALKLYPIIFLPFIFFYKPKDFIKNLKYFTIAFLPTLITILPFLRNDIFLTSFMGSGLTQKILEYKIGVVPLFPFLYLLILTNYFFSKSKHKFEIAISQVFLFFIGLVNFHPQWILWFFPFIVLNLFNFKNKFILLLFFLLTFVYIFLFNDNYLFWGHLTPISPYFASLTSPYQILKLKLSLNPGLIQNKIHQILLLLAIFTSLTYVKKK